MFVAKDGNYFVVFLKRTRDFFKKSPSWIKVLLLVVPGIATMLANADHAVDRNVFRAQGYRALDRVEDRYLILGSQKIAFGSVVFGEINKSSTVVENNIVNYTQNFNTSSLGIKLTKVAHL